MTTDDTFSYIRSAATALGLPSPDVLRARFQLTKREAEVTLLLATGLTDRQVAERLYISPHTARHHAEHVLQKLGLSSRRALLYHLIAVAR